MKFDAIEHIKPVLVVAGGKSLQEAREEDLLEASDKCTVIAINGAGRIQPDIRFFLDGQCHMDKSPDLQACFDREDNSELYAGRPSLWDDKTFLDYHVEDYMTPWNNTFLACLWIVLNNSTVNVYTIGGDCNSEYIEHVVWSEDYSKIVGTVQFSPPMQEHTVRLFDSSKREVGEILAKFPDRLFSLCGHHGKVGIPECKWSDIK